MIRANSYELLHSVCLRRSQMSQNRQKPFSTPFLPSPLHSCNSWMNRDEFELTPPSCDPRMRQHTSLITQPTWKILSPSWLERHQHSTSCMAPDLRSRSIPPPSVFYRYDFFCRVSPSFSWQQWTVCSCFGIPFLCCVMQQLLWAVIICISLIWRSPVPLMRASVSHLTTHLCWPSEDTTARCLWWAMGHHLHRMLVSSELLFLFQKV